MTKLLSLVCAFVLSVGIAVSAQNTPEVYTAMLIASEAVAGSGAGRVNIRIMSYTTDAERTSLKEAFQKSQADGLALLKTMSKGYINIEGTSGRKIYAAFSRHLQNGHEVVVVGEHIASKLEKWRNTDAAEHPLAVIHMAFDDGGKPVKGEVFPAVKVSVTEDGFVDVQTDSSNKVMMTDLARK